MLVSGLCNVRLLSDEGDEAHAEDVAGAATALLPQPRFIGYLCNISLGLVVEATMCFCKSKYVALSFSGNPYSAP